LNRTTEVADIRFNKEPWLN